MLFIEGIVLAYPVDLHTCVCHTTHNGRIFVVVWSNVANIEDICEFTFVGLSSAILS